VAGSCQCHPGATNCNGTCTNLLFDRKNCGACGYSCSVCCLGVCCSAAQPMCVNEGRCRACPAFELSCNMVCANPKYNPRNCGGCGNPCPPEANCIDGRCVCPSGTKMCSGHCVDLNNPQQQALCGNCSTCTCDATVPTCCQTTPRTCACFNLNGRLDHSCPVVQPGT
jgi:hypothetical protein